ncbi:MAG: nuclear transport factor 2 family protein [Microthrixaceae bacterium]|nr:nuclear transport factor 2 family protein [Microthrixaceae bacterium]
MSGEQESANVELVESFWDALGRRDFDAVGAMMSERGHYIDVAVIGVEDGAFGPEETAARLRLGLGPLERYELHDGPIVASGDIVVTEHNEEWFWHTGETVLLRFCSVMEVRGGKVDRWWDYFDLGAIMNAAPDWWIEQISVGYK